MPVGLNYIFIEVEFKQKYRLVDRLPKRLRIRTYESNAHNISSLSPLLIIIFWSIQDSCTYGKDIQSLLKYPYQNIYMLI